MRHYSIISSIIAATAAIFSAPEAQAYEFTFAQGFDAHGTVTVSYVEPGETEVMDVTEYFVALEQGETPEGSLPVNEGGTVSVSISPVRGWAVGSVTARTYMYTDEMRTRSGGAPSPSLGIDVDVTNAGNNVYTVTIPTANVRLTISWKKLIQQSWITLTNATGLVYDGTAKTPGVVVNDGDMKLSAETDYDVTYSNNKNACDATAENAPTVTVSVKDGNDTYTGSASVPFTIGTATVKASGFAVEDKEKNGDDVTAVLITTNVKLDGVIMGSGDKQGDDVDITGVTGTFEDADAGENKTVNLDYTNASLTGKDASNYTLDKVNSQQTATGKITVDDDVIEITKIKVNQNVAKIAVGDAAATAVSDGQTVQVAEGQTVKVTATTPPRGYRARLKITKTASASTGQGGEGVSGSGQQGGEGGGGGTTQSGTQTNPEIAPSGGGGSTSEHNLMISPRNSPITVQVNEAITFVAYDNGRLADVTWSVDTIDNVGGEATIKNMGHLTGIKPGWVIVTATLNDDKSVKTSIRVEVVE